MDMDPGNELLLSCLRNDRPDIKIAGLRNLKDDDWDALLHASHSSKTTPILYHTLGPFLSNIRIPTQVQQELRQAYHRSAAKNLRVYQQLLKLVGAFNHVGIPVILLKGAHLAELVYGNGALRPMGDLDLLVRKVNLSRASELLLKHGYTPSKQVLDRPLDICHLPAFKGVDSLPIEIHFNIVEPPFCERFDVAELWERSLKASIKGVEVLTLCPEDLLLHLCVHTAIRHGFDNGITPLLDISFSLDRYHREIDGDRILTRAKQWGAIRCVYVMLALSKKMLGSKIPEQIKMQVASGRSDFDPIASAEELLFEKAVPTASNVARLFGNDSWSDKLRLFVRRAFPPPETMPVVEGWGRNRLATSIMYFSRIRGVWKRHARTVWRVMLSDKDTSASMGIENRRNELRDWLTKT